MAGCVSQHCDGSGEHLGVIPRRADGLDVVATHHGVLCNSWKQQIICTLSSMHGSLKHSADWKSKNTEGDIQHNIICII